jgi:transcriptional regulator with XRE-family HTH domain
MKRKRDFKEMMTPEDEAFYYSIVHRIRELMKEKKITRDELARRMNVKPVNITHYLRGRNQIHLWQLPAFARALGVSVGDLLFHKIKPNEVKKVKAQDTIDLVLKHKKMFELLKDIVNAVEVIEYINEKKIKPEKALEVLKMHFPKEDGNAQSQDVSKSA